MSQINRIMFTVYVTVGMGICAVIYIRGALPLLIDIEQSGGPMSTAATQAKFAIPLTILLIEGSTLLYMVFGSAEEEKARVTGP